MKKYSLIIGFFVGIQAIFLTVPVDARDLISVIVADTYDESIGDSTAADMHKMRAMMSRIASHTGMRHREVVIKDNHVVASKVLQDLKTLKVNEDDVVIFYFSGHGYRTASKGDSMWPNLYFSIHDEGIEYEKVVNLLQNKKPRLLITMSDVCNNVIPERGAPALVRGVIARGVNEELVKSNYRRLFLETTGLIRVTSAKVGEFAWATESGGTYTLAFLKSLDQEARSSALANWSSLLDRASLDVGKDDQHPVYVIETNNH